MSYILDALKKSEQQRPPGPVPDLFSLHGPQPSAPGRPARAIAAVSLLLLASAIGSLAWFGADRRDRGADTAGIATGPPPQAAPPATPVTPRADVSPAPDLEALRGVGEEGRRSSTRRTIALAPPAQKPEGVAGSPAPAEAPAATSPAVSAVPVAPPPATDETPATAPSAPEVPGGSPIAAESSPPEEAPPADGRVFDALELPAPIRAQLPALVVSGHVWSDDPGLRLMTVNDRLLREGAEAAPGVRLLEVTPAGAVFVFKGWHFRAGGVRP